jgi:HD-GYP domain-containing protein (c-di-GMP phosphodiesterase class II)
VNDAAAGGSGIRLTELLGALSLGIDLGIGHAMEHVVRQSLLTARLAGLAGLDERHCEVAYYGSLLAWVGCHVDAYEQAKWFGDDQALKYDFRLVDAGKPSAALSMLRHVGAGKPPFERARVAAGFVTSGWRAASEMLHNHWRAADALMERLGIDQEIRDVVEQTFERWDGKGVPHGAKGDDILLASRIVNLADVVEVFHRAGGVDAAVAVARARRGTQFDPALVDLCCAEAPKLFAGIDGAETWDALLAAGPAGGRDLSEAQLDDALEAIADFVDLKSPYTIGHSRGVADLAGAAARAHGLSERDVVLVHRAALVHDLGRLGVSNAIWDKRTPLTAGEVERIRLHPHYTERMLASSPALAPLAAVAVQHHERLDGSGYPRGSTGDALSTAGRVLAAADMYRAKSEPRPHRPAEVPSEIAAALRVEVRNGRLDAGAVDAVLTVAGHRVARRRTWPAGLTAREVDVLRLVARGLSHREIAQRLTISPKTASNHVEHIYTKIGATNRAMAGMFAMRHGLMLDDDE